jgi:hypothetical protein
MALLKRRNKTPEEKNEAIFKEMARLKIQISELDQKYKLLEAKAKGSGVKKLKIKEGSFSLVEKENWEVPDTTALAEEMGTDLYITHSTISKKGIEDAGGKTLLERIKGKNLLTLKSKTRYFLFKKA